MSAGGHASAINYFRKYRLADVIDDILTRVVQMLVDAKFVRLEFQYIDGTKIEANANKYTYVWKKATSQTYPTATVVMSI